MESVMKVRIKGKKPAPNGMYWGNIEISQNKYKIVMVEPITENAYRAWSNSNNVIGLQGWKVCDFRDGWVYKDMHPDKFSIFDWIYYK